MTDKPTPDETPPDASTPDKPTSDKTPPPALSVEARLAAYGAVLRDELDEATGKIASISVLTIPTDATADQDLGAAHMRAGTAPAQRGGQWRTGILVAAVLALIAGIGVFSLQNNNADRTVQVASQPSTVPDGQSDDGAESADDAGDTTNGDSADDGAGSEAGAPASPTTPPEDGTTSTDSDVTADDPDGVDPDESPTALPLDVMCEIGTLQGNVCVIVGDPPVAGPDVCPVSATVFEDAQGCYRIVPLSADCAGLTTLDENWCREPVELVSPPSECTEGFTLRAFDGTCTRPAPSTTRCAEGRLEQGQCVVTGSAPTQTCPDGADIIEENGQCFRIEEASCGDLEPVANTNECRAQGTVVDSPTCSGTPPPPAIADPVVGGQCVVTAPPTEYCDGDAVLDNGECVRIEEFEDFEICPISATVFEDVPIPGCWELFDFLPDSTCPQGVPTPDATQCFQAVPLDILPECFGTPVVDPVTGHDMCEFRDPALIGCGAYDYPNPTPAPPSGCLRFDGPPVVLLSCVETGVVVATSADCFTTIQASCAAAGCRTQVDPNPGTGQCATGFELGPNNDSCIRYSSPATECLEGERDLDGTSCVVLGATPGGSPTCPTGDDIIDDGVNCYRRVPRATCGDLVEIAAGCRTAVELRPVTLSCPQQGFGLVNNQCVRYEEPVSLTAADE